MTIFNEKEYLIGTAEYGANFWNAMRGIQHAYDKIHGGANGIINQKAILQKYADDNGFRNTFLFVDDGYSGTTFDRPDWNRLMGLVDEGRVGTIIVKDMSRLGRDYLKVGMYTEMVFPNADIRFIAINNGVDSANQSENDMTPFINIFKNISCLGRVFC